MATWRESDVAKAINAVCAAAKAFGIIREQFERLTAARREDFRRVGRTVHVGIGYVSALSYLTTVILQF